MLVLLTPISSDSLIIIRSKDVRRFYASVILFYILRRKLDNNCTFLEYSLLRGCVEILPTQKFALLSASLKKTSVRYAWRFPDRISIV